MTSVGQQHLHELHDMRTMPTHPSKLRCHALLAVLPDAPVILGPTIRLREGQAAHVTGLHPQHCGGGKCRQVATLADRAR